MQRVRAAANLPVVAVREPLTLFLQMYGNCLLHASDSNFPWVFSTPQSDSVRMELPGIPAKHIHTHDK